MIGNFKKIHIGQLIAKRMEECAISLERAARFINVSEEEIEKMYTLSSLDSYILLRWSKLLKYDFFRVYTQHLILYAPQYPLRKKDKNVQEAKSELPILKKNIYTYEIISYLVELVESGKKTTKQLQEEYNIPSTTVFRWVNKARKKKNEQH